MNSSWQRVISAFCGGLPIAIDERHAALCALVEVMPKEAPERTQVVELLSSLDRHLANQGVLALGDAIGARGCGRLADQPLQRGCGRLGDTVIAKGRRAQ